MPTPGTWWRTRAERTRDDAGFTLIELLVVVVILGVLIAVAIPLYLNYRKGANDAATQSDLRNAISVLEVCQTENKAYPATLPAQTTADTRGPVTPPTRTDPPVPLTACTGQVVNLSAGTQLSYFAKAANGYVLSGTNSNGTTTKFFCYDSTVGGALKTQAAAGTASGC